MASMNAGIILSGQQPDFVNILDRSNQAAQTQIGNQRQNALAATIQREGPGALAGNQQSLNALARFDPAAAQSLQAGQQSMRINEEQLRLSYENARMTGQEYASKISTQEAEAKAKAIERALAMGTQAQTPEQWDGIMQQVAPEYVGQFDQRQIIIAGAMGLAEALKMGKGPDPKDYTSGAPTGTMWNDPNDPRQGVAPITGIPTEDPAWRAATPEEAAAYGAVAGQINARTGEFKAINPQSGMKLTTNPDGSVSLQQGPGVTGGDKQGDIAGLANPGGFIDAINATLNDPALDWSTGALEWTQFVPGSPMRRFKGRADQLKGKAFIAARDSLKGQGQITDFESQRAEAAIGRLDTAQGPQDYRDALEELRGILATGMARQRGWVDTTEGKIYGMSAAEINDLEVEKLSDAELRAAQTRLKQLVEQGGR
jgi:hypothetical protein